MTLPEVKNCDHLEDGWCLDCAKDYHDLKEAQIKILQKTPSSANTKTSRKISMLSVGK